MNIYSFLLLEIYICGVQKLKNAELSLYLLDNNYITFLKKLGHTHVENNYANLNARQQKPYVGIVLNVNGQDFFAPLSSPKDKYEKVKDSNPTIFKIKAPKNQNLIGVVKLNNMIPAPSCAYKKLEIEKITDSKYKYLLQNQIKFMKVNLSSIKTKASIMYHLVVNKGNKFYCRISNDFAKLEKDCEKYISNSVVNDEKLKNSTFNSSYLNDWVTIKENIKNLDNHKQTDPLSVNNSCQTTEISEKSLTKIELSENSEQNKPKHGRRR